MLSFDGHGSPLRGTWRGGFLTACGVWQSASAVPQGGLVRRASSVSGPCKMAGFLANGERCTSETQWTYCQQPQAGEKEKGRKGYTICHR